jgi:hypothetical protein
MSVESFHVHIGNLTWWHDGGQNQPLVQAGLSRTALKVYTCVRPCIQLLVSTASQYILPTYTMLSRFRRKDNEQIVELQGLNNKVGTTVSETDEDRLSIERIHNNGKGHSHGRFWQWILEILSLVGALLLLCTIVGLLVGYHDNKQPVWKYSISLNSLVALLSTLFKALMMIVVAEGTLFLSFCSRSC